jgi:hypothetical protein
LKIREHKVPNDMLERRGISPEGMEVALTTEAVLHVRHWTHLVVANYVALFALWFELTPWKVLRYLWAVVRAIWPTKARIARTLTVRGKNCKIHPSAVVETSVLGDNVEIGPGAVVRGSILADNVKVDTLANVNQAAIGKHAVISFNTICNLCVVYPQALISLFGAQMSVIGRRAAVLGFSHLLDVRDPFLKEEVLVVDGEQRVASGRKVLGPCIGHEAIVAADVRLAPGVFVPNGAYLIPRPQDLVRKIDAALPAGVPHYVDGGTVVPARRTTGR